MTFYAKQLLLLFSACILLRIVLANSSSYKAAVVEFAPANYLIGHNLHTSKEMAQQNMMTNVNSMEELVRSASTQGAQIIVFPEHGVTGRIFCRDCTESVRAYGEDIPEVMSETTPIIPCTASDFDNRPILRALSCIAHNHSIVLVVNMIDKKSDLLFNSDVIFDENGALIAKYYKQHLFDAESSFFTTPSNNVNRYITFSTSFGVTFSVFICYDILFCDPPLEMVKRGIKNFVFSTHWGNRYPHYMSISVRQGWSWKNKVNIISSGISHRIFPIVKFYSSGSGIYSAGKPLGYYISGERFTEPSGRLIIADVPLDPGQADDISSGQRERLSDLKSRDTRLNYQMIDPTETSLEATFEELTCSIEYRFSSLANTESYALAASVYTSQGLTYALCSLSRRSDNFEQLQSTGYAANSKFQYLKLNGTFMQYPQITVMPMVLGDQLQLLDPSIFVLEDDSLTLQNGEQSILVANLWGKIAGGNDGYCSEPETSDPNNVDPNNVVPNSVPRDRDSGTKANHTPFCYNFALVATSTYIIYVVANVGI